ncbi:MAG: C1 family peptidase [Bacteroidetes bacterium]|nr:C1 family peptidase [Bacteroidota bacterium]MBS1630526.1 C1 family peptidase [Bacteroidota bacterium]
MATKGSASKSETKSRNSTKKSAPAKRLSLEGPHRILNILPSKNTERDWTFENALDAEILGSVRALPLNRDLRAAWWKINDQGDTGSCVGWATADSVLRWLFVQAGRLAQTELLSPRFIWMAAKETDEFTSQPSTFLEADGTSLKAALDIARKYGVVADSILPFASGKLYGNAPNTFYALAAQRKVSSYFNLGTQPGNWRTWLATKGPILTRLGVDATWDNATSTKGVMNTYQPKTIRGGHAVALVGYKGKSFIVRNSWGTGWGDQGYGYASEAYAKAAFTEAYGVVL